MKSKKQTIIGIILATLLVFSLFFVFAAPNLDLNGDGSVTVADISSLAQLYRGKGTYNASYDFDNDTDIDLFDLVRLARNVSSGESDTSITLEGVGFGTKETAAPLYFSTFEDATLEAHVTDPSVGLEVLESSGNESNPHVVNDRAHAGTQSLRADYLAGGSYFRGVGVSNFPAGALDIYVGQWVYITGDVGADVAVFKFTRAGSGDPYQGNPKFVMTLGVDAISDVVDCTYHDGANGSDPIWPDFLSSDTWIWMESRYRLSTSGVADGWFNAFIGSTQIVNFTDVATRASGITAEADWAISAFDGADRVTGGDVYLYVDELIIDDTFARVITTDNQIYDNSANWAPQKPNSWNDTEIVIDNPNWGSFSSGQTVYFHVFDANDNWIDSFSQIVP